MFYGYISNNGTSDRNDYLSEGVFGLLKRNGPKNLKETVTKSRHLDEVVVQSVTGYGAPV